MTQTRHKRDLYTPGSQTPGKPEIIRDDQEIRAKYNGIQDRRRELAARLQAVNGEIGGILASLGVLMADRGDWRGAAEKLAELRAEREALQAAVDYLKGQADLLKRLNPWL